MMKQLQRIALCLLPLMLNVAFADKGDPVGIGAVADNMLGPVDLANNFVMTACIVLGSSFLFASIIKYFEHRRSPLMVPMGTVVFLVLAGLFLLILPFAYLLTQSGVSFQLMKSS